MGSGPLRSPGVVNDRKSRRKSLVLFNYNRTDDGLILNAELARPMELLRSLRNVHHAGLDTMEVIGQRFRIARHIDKFAILLKSEAAGSRAFCSWFAPHPLSRGACRGGDPSANAL